MIRSAQEVRLAQFALPVSDLAREVEGAIEDAISKSLQDGRTFAEVALEGAAASQAVAHLRTQGYKVEQMEFSVLNPGRDRVVRFSW